MHGENPWRAVFLGALEATGNVSEAARRAGVHRATPYGARGADSAFREAWDQALEAATDALEGEARRRALEGWEEPDFLGGRDRRPHPAVRLEAADVLAPGAWPEKYRENSRVEHPGDRTIRVEYADRDCP